MKTRTFLLALFLIAAFALLAWRLAQTRKTGAEVLDSPSVVMQIQRLSTLTTVRYSIQRVVGLTEQKVPFGSESILLMVQGEAEAGLDLDQLKQRDVEITADGMVRISLPPAKLTGVYLDEKQTKVWDRGVTWWTPWVPYNPDLEHKARLQAIDDVRSAALQMGIIGQAQHNAQVAITGLLSAFHLRAQFRSPD